MPFIATTDEERAEMLAEIGVERIEDLFLDVPELFRYPPMNLPEPLSELEAIRDLGSLAGANESGEDLSSFIGAGAYHHFSPSVVNFLAGRSEFYSAYTPYQAEVSQGTLQAIFEYQTMIAALTGMDVANASHYDGATATAEAVIMALNMARGRRKRIVLSPTVNAQYREVVRTYTQGMDLDIVGDGDLDNDFHALIDLCNDDTAIVVVQNPDFLGQLHSPAEMQDLANAVHAAGAVLAVAVDLISLGLFTPPGDYGADIVMGEGQSLGNAISFGGPYLGFFAMRQKDVRRSAGRIAGETVDADDNTGYVLTLNTREQHIRRGRATSNICTNQAWNALMASIYLAVMGKHGLRSVAEQCYHKAHYAAARINELDGFEVLGSRPFFKEFVIRCPVDVSDLKDYLLTEWGVLPGYDLTGDYPDLGQCLLVCVTEMNSRQEIDDLVEALTQAASVLTVEVVV
ncbi:MAG: aminomethyl-transferring glycine dehydrogenase subunit GcvPA [Chloroflexota bacterium]|nr:aminomethyl-transferring glycine dehydrogenase subunit GcvPA [Chloroflexota bacterium]